MDTLKDAYWKANIRLVTGCLIVWFIVSFGFGILLVDFFNHFRIGGYKLGFWFAQQGSIFTFLILISWRGLRRVERHAQDLLLCLLYERT